MIPSGSPQQAGGATSVAPGGVTENAGEALKHFATAFLFLVAGLAALLFNSEMLATGGVRASRVIAGLHFITLGWLTLSIFGALQVFTGVALGGVQLNSRLSPWGRWIWTVGLILFVFGFFIESAITLASGFLTLGIALILYSTQMIPAIYKAKRGQLTRIFIAIAFFCLWCAWILGVIGGLARSGWAPAIEVLPVGYLQAHILLAIFGWVGSMVIGVGSHLVPMFALSRNTSQTPLKAALAFWSLLPVAGILSAFYPDPGIAISWRIAAAGSLCWAIQFGLYFRNRIRRDRDYGLLIAAAATAFMVLAWLGAGFLKDPTPFIALVLVGWLSLFTLGIYHRVLPFLVWFMRFSRPAKGIRPPKVKDLIDSGVSVLVGTLVAFGIVVWFSGLWLHSVRAAYCGSALMLVGVLLTLLQLKTLRGGAAISPAVVARLKAALSFSRNGGLSWNSQKK